MSRLCKLLGDKLTAQGGEEVGSASLAAAGRVVGLYFSAHWCPPCRGFTPTLVNWYNSFKKTEKGELLELVFVSSDRDEPSFKEYYAEMPWLALPFADREKKNKLSKKFKVKGIPTLVFIDAETGKLITDKGRGIVTDDPEGKGFPWHPKPLSELLPGKLKRQEAELDESELKGKVFGFYFSAHWCPPCRAFTPELVKTYNKLKEDGKNFEIVFVSSDRTEESFNQYYSEMPWLALPYGDKRKETLSKHFSIEGIPSLVIVNEENEVITSNGRAAVSADKEGKEFPWYPKPVNELNAIFINQINESACMILFTDDTADVDETKALLLDEAVAHQEASANPEADDVPELFFFYAIDNDENEVIESVRDFANLDDRNPLLVLIDVPEQRMYVHPKDKPITKETVKEVAAAFKDNKLQMETMR